MWSNDDDFLKDEEALGEIWEINKIQNTEQVMKQSVGRTREHKTRLYSFSDDDEEEEENNSLEDSENEDNHLKVITEVERQVAKVFL